MKTAISVPDNLFKNAEKTAAKMGVSRSNLFSRAIKEYLDNHNPTHVTKKLNAIYSSTENKLDKNIVEMQIQSIEKGDW